MFRIVMLGSGGALPSPNRNVSCVGIRYNGKVYAFDACEGMQKQMMKYKLSYYKTYAIFISHLHPDHYLGIPGLVYTLQLSKFDSKLHIIGPKGIKRVVKNLLIGNVPEFVDVNEFEEEGIVMEGDGIYVKAFKVKHGDSSYGYVMVQQDVVKFYEEKAKKMGIRGKMFKEIAEKKMLNINGKRVKLDEVSWVKKGRKIVYTGDTVYCDNVVRNSKGADVLIHDATFTETERKDANEKMHATSLDAAKTAKDAECELLVLTHISNKYKNDEAHLNEAKPVFSNSVVAKDGLEIHI